jgi:hypothetical protein
MKLDPATYELILGFAYDAADAAIKKELERRPEDMNAFDCGFAWVDAPDGRHPFIRHCSKRSGDKIVPGVGYNDRNHGEKHWKKGWQFWSPGVFHGQSIRIKYVGAVAFANILNEHFPELGAFADSRLD